MLNKSVPVALAMFAVLLMLNDAQAQSGSRNIAPSFSGGSASRNIAPSFSGGFSTAPTNVQPAPTTTFAPSGGYAPAATPLDTIQIQSSPAPVQTVTSAPAYSQPVYSQPVYSQPVTSSYSSGCSGCGATQSYYSPAPTYSAPVYSQPVYSQPVVRSFAPVRRSCCGCR